MIKNIARQFKLEATSAIPRRQIMTYKDGPSTERINISIGRRSIKCVFK